jgi:hypothetical protein
VGKTKLNKLITAYNELRNNPNNDFEKDEEIFEAVDKHLSLLKTFYNSTLSLIK